MCVICFDEENVHATLSCSHSFHLKCLMKWWVKQEDDDIEISCPLCRSEPDDDELEWLRLRVFTEVWITTSKKGDVNFKRFITKIKNQLKSVGYTKMDDLLWAPEFVSS